MQATPRCYECYREVDDPVFEPPCGHDACASAVWHPACLMDWRDQEQARDEALQSLAEGVERAASR